MTNEKLKKKIVEVCLDIPASEWYKNGPGFQTLVNGFSVKLMPSMNNLPPFLTVEYIDILDSALGSLVRRIETHHAQIKLEKERVFLEQFLHGFSVTTL